MIPVTGVTAQQAAGWRQVPNNLIGGTVLGLFVRSALRAKQHRDRVLWERRKAELRRRSEQGRWEAGPAPSVGGGLEVQNPLRNVFNQPILISVRTQETYSYQADVTKHAVESGAVYSDHVIIQPLQVDLAFAVTNWEPDRPREALEALEELFLAREPLELVTQHRVLPDMVLASLSADNVVDTWGALSFRATFQQVRRVRLQTERFPLERLEPLVLPASSDAAALFSGADVALQSGPTSLPADPYDQLPEALTRGAPDTQGWADATVSGAPLEEDVRRVVASDPSDLEYTRNLLREQNIEQVSEL